MILLNYTHLDRPLPHSAVRSFLQNLPSNKAQTISRLVDDKQRSASVLGLVLLEHAMQQMGFSDFDFLQLIFSPNQKPSCTANIEFNITHSDSLVACAVSQASPVGIDSETSNREHNTLLRHAFNDAELEQISDGSQSLLDLWVQKEAVVKATGGGITDLKYIQLDHCTALYQNQRWFLHRLPLDDNDISYLACKQQNPEIKIRYHSFSDCLSYCTTENTLSQCHG